MDFTPEEKLLMFNALAEECRKGIRRGEEAALREYVSLQWNDPVLDDFQWDILKSGMLGGINEIAIKGCTSPGKGYSVALLANCWFDVFPESKVIVTSSDISHATRVMFGEVKAIRQLMAFPGTAKVMTEEFKGLIPTGRMIRDRVLKKDVPEYEDDPKHYLIVANPKSGEGFSGAHGPATLFIFDEASSVLDELYKNARQQALLIVALSNPRVLSGWFYDLFRPADEMDKTQTIPTPVGPRRLFTIGGMDCRNVREKRLKKPFGPLGGIEIAGQHFKQGERIPEELFKTIKTVIPNQMDYAKYAETMADPDEFHRRVFGQGQFPKEDAATNLFMKAWFERARKAWNPNLPVDAFGLDLAASTFGDETVLAAGGTLGCREFHAWKKADTTLTVAEVLKVAIEVYGIDLKRGTVPVAVDMQSIGSAVFDMLTNEGVLCVEVWANGAPQVNREKYANRRAEVYGELSSRMNPEEYPQVPFAIPPNEPKLDQELSAHHKIPSARGFSVTPKDRYRGMVFNSHTIKEHIGRSPDRSDALAYLYAAVRTLDSGVSPVLQRPLVLLTEEEQLALAIEEGKEQEEESPEAVADREFNEQIAQLLGWEREEPVKEVPYPSFL